MKVLVLTNPEHVRFVTQELLRYFSFDFLVRFTGEYDWSEEYDVGISFMYQYRVPKEQLDRPWFNFHPGPLPEYKGRNLCYNALMNGEREFGATLHYMDEDFDTGAIIKVSRFPIEDHWCADDLSRATFQESERLFSKYLPRILGGYIFPTVENRGGKYYRKEEIDDLLYLPEDIENKIRAITYKEFCPRIRIGDQVFKVVRE